MTSKCMNCRDDAFLKTDMYLLCANCALEEIRKGQIRMNPSPSLPIQPPVGQSFKNDNKQQ